MELEEQLTLFSRYGEDELFTAALQLMRRIYDEVVNGDEEPVHGDLPAAIEDLCLGPWREVDRPLVAAWPYGLECALLRLLMKRLEDTTSTDRGLECALTTRWLLGPSAIHLWASG